MKYLLVLFVSLMAFVSANASTTFRNEPIEGTRIEMVNDYTFFILNLEEKEVSVNYGDKVELFFGFNSKITLYNISGKDIHTFTNHNELVVLISAEDLRCFKNRKLRKVKIYTKSQSVVVKTNIGPDHLKIK